MNRKTPGMLVIAAALAAAFAVACGGVDNGLSCKTVIDTMYGEDCEMWCDEDDWEDADSCNWWADDDPSNYDDDDAEEVCEDMREEAQRKKCVEEFNVWLQCSIDEVDESDEEDQCAPDCDDEYADFYDCIY